MISVGYSYELSGDLKFEKEEFIAYCRDNELEAYHDDRLDEESIREFLLEKVDLVKMANDGRLVCIEDDIREPLS